MPPGQTDNDNDGYQSSIDCNDTSGTGYAINPGVAEDCDHGIDNDCDDDIDCEDSECKSVVRKDVRARLPPSAPLEN